MSGHPLKTAAELLSFCADSGVELWAEDGRLRYQGAASVVAPLLTELQRFKIALLELLAAPTASALETSKPGAVAVGAARIGAWLQSYESVFQAARRGELPDAPLNATIGGEPHTIEAAALLAIKTKWRQRASECQRDARANAMRVT